MQKITNECLHMFNTGLNEPEAFIRRGIATTVCVPSGEKLRVADHGPQRFLQVVSSRVRKLPEFHVFSSKRRFYLSRRLLGEFPVMNIDAGTNVSQESLVRGKAWDGRLHDPAEYSVVPLQPVFNLEAPELDGGVIIHGATPLAIVRMDTVEPAGPNLVLDRTAAVRQPRAIEVAGEFVGVSAPDHHGR